MQTFDQPLDPPPALRSNSAFGLQLNPFAPEVRIGGQASRFRYGSGPLNPRQSEEHLRLYFNLYAWMDKNTVLGLDDAGRLVKLDRSRSDRAMVVLISGFSGSGRTSCKNLLLYEIEQRLKRKPLVVESGTGVTSNRLQDAADFTMLLLEAIEELPDAAPLLKAVEKTLKRWRENVVGGTPNPDTLFTLLKQRIDKLLPGLPVVFSLDASSHKVSSDVWRPACTMLSQLADYIIVSLSKSEHAQFFRANLSIGEFQVSWIDAPKVSQGRMAEFLERRLAQERLAGLTPAGPLSPFTPEALGVLFSSAGGGGNEPESLTIAVAMAKLAGVFERKIGQLALELAAVAENATSLPPDALAITGKDMEDFLASQ